MEEINFDKGKINLNEVAREVAKLEAGKEEVNIAQIKEIMKNMCIVLGRYEYPEIIDVIERYKKKNKIIDVPQKKTFAEKFKNIIKR